MKKIIVTTTISQPTEATIKYSNMEGWEFIVVGDLKTPKESYDKIKCDYLTVEYQNTKWPTLSNLIGWNCAERKTLGVLEAYERGADLIAIVDDDNVPLENWGKNILIGKEVEVFHYETNRLCFDPLYHTNYPRLWHRGYPLQLLKNRNEYVMHKKIVIPDVQSGLWNNEPDIDAICRMEHLPKCNFSKNNFPMSTNTFSPFNSQNTILSRKAAKEYFMMGRTGRMTDIWASFYNQACGFKMVYTEVDVRHDRHVHDETKDFKDEILGNIHTLNLLKDLKENPMSIINYLSPETSEGLLEYKKQIKLIDERNKYDVIIKSGKKDYVKLKLVINSIKFLNPQPSKIFLINPDGYKPEGTDYEDKIVVVKDEEVFPGCDRNKIRYRKNWCFATFIALFQDVTEQNYYLDIQSDNFFVKPIDLFTSDNKPIFFMSPQHSHYNPAYFNFSKKMFDLERVGDDSFIIDFMMYDKRITKKMLKNYNDFNHFFNIACYNINSNSYPTEQDCYANWCLKHDLGYHVKKNVQTILMGKLFPLNYTEKEIIEILDKHKYSDSVSISLHTWETP